MRPPIRRAQETEFRRQRRGHGISEQKYLTELSRLLSFMSAWDRARVMEEYRDRFYYEPDPERLIDELGSPTQVAISIARGYVPSPRPEDWTGESVTDSGPVFNGATPMPADALLQGTQAGQLEGEQEPRLAQNDIRPVGLVFFILFALVIGLPFALLFIAVGVPFLVLGVGMVSVAVYACIQLIPHLSMASDLIMTVGAGAVLGGLGLLLLWFGLWLSIQLGKFWIGGVLSRIGTAWCYRKGAAA